MGDNLCKCGHPRGDHYSDLLTRYAACLSVYCHCLKFDAEPHVNRNMAGCMKCGAKWPKDMMIPIQVKTAHIHFCKTCWDES
jgi:hypothetical protein